MMNEWVNLGMELWRVQICIWRDKHRTRYSRWERSILHWTQVFTFMPKWCGWQTWLNLHNWSDHICSHSCHSLQVVFLHAFLIIIISMVKLRSTTPHLWLQLGQLPKVFAFLWIYNCNRLFLKGSLCNFPIYVIYLCGFC